MLAFREGLDRGEGGRGPAAPKGNLAGGDRDAVDEEVQLLALPPLKLASPTVPTIETWKPGVPGSASTVTQSSGARETTGFVLSMVKLRSTMAERLPQTSRARMASV